MDVFEKFGTDKELESETGITLVFGDGCTVTIKRAGASNRKYAEVAKRVFKPYRTQIDADALDHDLAVKLFARIYAEAVVTDWQGITFKGEPMPYSAENVRKLFEAAPDFLARIKAEAENAANFRDAEREADAGN
jgi:hypothetical protein